MSGRKSQAAVSPSAAKSRSATARKSRPQGVVVDTALLLQVLLHNGSEAALLRQAWHDGLIRLMVCAETAQLLMLSLAAPVLKLKPVQQQELLADVLPYAQACKPLQQRASARLPLGPLLALSLAQAAGAALLLSESEALHKHVGRQASRYPGLQVLGLREWVDAHSR
jgi:predicted nucleic acid-binding protein